MGKINLTKPLSKDVIKKWESFIRFWDSWGLQPKKAFKILGKYYLDHKENYTYKDMNVFDNLNNRKFFVSLVGYIYWYMKENNIRWEAALKQLCTNNDQFVVITLEDMLIPGATLNGNISWQPATFAKRVKQWRQYFFDQGWLHKDMRPEIIKARKALERKGVIRKKRSRQLAKIKGKAIGSHIIGDVIKNDPFFKKSKKKKS